MKALRSSIQKPFKHPRFGLPLSILLAGILASLLLISIKKPAPKIAPKTNAVLVKTRSVESQNTLARISVFGTVKPVRELVVQPQVSGQVTSQHAEMINGGKITAGEILIQIDPRDYEAAVLRAEAEFARAEYELELEKGNQIVARQEWQLLEPDLKQSDLSKRLALREPQLKQKQAALLAARSSLEKARLDLERTSIKAPFDSLVIEENCEVGQFVNSQNILARLVESSEFFVEASLPLSQLHWIKFPDNNSPGSSALVRLRSAGNTSIERRGQVHKLLGQLEQAGRMARIFIKISDPLDLQNAGKNSLLLGSYVEALIDGQVLENVFVIPSEALREDNSVWLVGPDQTLVAKQVQIALHLETELVIKSGLNTGDQIIISPVPGALPGMKLEVQSTQPAINSKVGE